MTTRTDIHKPSAIVPDEYTYIAQNYVDPEGFGYCVMLENERRVLAEHMKTTSGGFSTHYHGGNCMICGNVRALYLVIYYHEKTNTYLRVGGDCATKLDLGGDFDASLFRDEILAARKRHTSKQFTIKILEEAGLFDCWTLHLAFSDVETRWEERTINSIVHTIMRYGKFSPAQEKFLHSLLQKIADRPALEAKREADRNAAEDVPTGRLEITGTIVSTKIVESDYGTYTKMLVRSVTGYKVWGTRPIALEDCETGTVVTFTATIKPSRDDSKFGFFSRPHAQTQAA